MDNHRYIIDATLEFGGENTEADIRRVGLALWGAGVRVHVKAAQVTQPLPEAIDLEFDLRADQLVHLPGDDEVTDISPWDTNG